MFFSLWLPAVLIKSWSCLVPRLFCPSTLFQLGSPQTQVRLEVRMLRGCLEAVEPARLWRVGLGNEEGGWGPGYLVTFTKEETLVEDGCWWFLVWKYRGWVVCGAFRRCPAGSWSYWTRAQRCLAGDRFGNNQCRAAIGSLGIRAHTLPSASGNP